MKNLANMYSLSSKLWYDKRWISKAGESSLYLQVTLNGKHKEFPLKLKWPVDHIDLVNGVLLPRQKRDPDVDDYNLMIMMVQGKHTEILRTYRIKRAPIDIIIFSKEVRVFDNRESFAAYMQKQTKFRHDTKEICKRTFRNHSNSLVIMLGFDKAWPIESLNEKWMRRFKSYLMVKGFEPGYIWATIKCTKTYLRLASNEPLLHIAEDAVNFPNPLPDWKTTYLNKEEVRRLLIVYRSGILSELQTRVCAAFLFQCFTSLRISDVYRANSKWKLSDDYLEFIPKKNEKAHRWLQLPIMPMARTFIKNTAGAYFDLPNEGEYNLQLKKIAGYSDINKKLTSHVGRHTFGYIYMTNVGNLKGLQEIMGHRKIETTMRYAHLDEEYQLASVKKMQEGFSDLVMFRVK